MDQAQKRGFLIEDISMDSKWEGVWDRDEAECCILIPIFWFSKDSSCFLPLQQAKYTATTVTT